MTAIPIDPPTPGTYTAIPQERYHATRALGSSGMWCIHAECPAMYFYDSPFNPDAAPRERKRAFDIGSACHLLTLEPGTVDGRIAAIPFDDYRTKEAQRQKQDAYDADRIPLLTHEVEMVKAMREAIFSHPVARHAFTGGAAETSLFWRDAATGAPCKGRLDYCPPHRRYYPDLKTSTTANPASFERRAADLGYYAKVAWYLEGLRELEGEAPPRACFIVVAKEPPHLVAVCWLDDEALAWGRMIARKAVETFMRCLERQEWPGYRDPTAPDRDGSFTIGLPGFTRKRLQDAHERGEFETPRYDRLVAAGGHPLA
jgi:PDDEXK-like domain of unknown function (DUF3799)